MQTIMSFEYPQRKRRKTLRACRRCKEWKVDHNFLSLQAEF